MSRGLKTLRFLAHITASLGLLSITLTAEISPSWLMASWVSWAYSVLASLIPSFQARIKRWETTAVVGMVTMLFLDFFFLKQPIFIAITHFLLLFQIVKLIGEKGRKDSLQIFLFSFFQILAACTLSVDAWHAAILLALIPTATAILFWNQAESQHERFAYQPDLATQKSYRRMAALICSLSLPLNVLLTMTVFVLFPRLTFNATLPGFSGNRTGYTDQLNLAQRGTLEQDASVALWLSFIKEEDRSQWKGYLRGEVLSHFDGQRWSVAKGRLPRTIAPDLNGVFWIRNSQSGLPTLRFSVTLADTSANTLFTIGHPLRIIAPLPSLQELPGGSLHWTKAWNRPLRYDVLTDPTLEKDREAQDLELPTLPLDRIRSLAEKVAGNGSPLEQATRIENHLQTAYRYSASFGDRISDNPIDHFLFERKEGLCSHFASAMALMLRLRHIPSRVVAGYLRGEWNEPGKCMVIRARDAHAWVEAYVEGQGWVRFDPSPRPAVGTPARRSLTQNLFQYVDYLDLQWNRFIIQYDLYSQMKALENLKGTTDRFGTLVFSWWKSIRGVRTEKTPPSALSPLEDRSKPMSFPIKKLAYFLLLSIPALFFAYHRQTSYASTIRFYRQFLDKMAREGHPKAPTETGKEYAARLAREKPEHSKETQDMTEKYYMLRFSK